MESNELSQMEKFSTYLFYGCLAFGAFIWVKNGFLYSGTPEEEMWAPIAGFFMGYIYAGAIAFLPALAAGIEILDANEKRPRAKLILTLSTLWLVSVILMYAF